MVFQGGLKRLLVLLLVLLACLHQQVRRHCGLESGFEKRCVAWQSGEGLVFSLTVDSMIMIHVVARTPFGSWTSDGSESAFAYMMHALAQEFVPWWCGLWVRSSATPRGLPNTNHAGHQKPAGSAGSCKVYAQQGDTGQCVAPAVTLETQCHTTPPQPRLVSKWSSLPRVGYPLGVWTRHAASPDTSRSPGSGVEVCATACCPPVLRYKRCWGPNPLTRLPREAGGGCVYQEEPTSKEEWQGGGEERIAWQRQ